MKQLEGFTADKYDPVEWVSLIKESGARYAVLTSKHHDGVALWDSKYRNDLSYFRSLYFAQRLNADEWTRNIKNPFADGHIPETGETPENYGYINNTDYSSVNYPITSPPQEIEIRPSGASGPVGIRYVKVPTKPTLIGDSVQFPAFVMDIFVQSTLMRTTS